MQTNKTALPAKDFLYASRRKLRKIGVLLRKTLYDFKQQRLYGGDYQKRNRNYYERTLNHKMEEAQEQSEIKYFQAPQASDFVKNKAGRKSSKERFNYSTNYRASANSIKARQKEARFNLLAQKRFPAVGEMAERKNPPLNPKKHKSTYEEYKAEWLAKNGADSENPENAGGKRKYEGSDGRPYGEVTVNPNPLVADNLPDGFSKPELNPATQRALEEDLSTNADRTGFAVAQGGRGRYPCFASAEQRAEPIELLPADNLGVVRGDIGVANEAAAVSGNNEEESTTPPARQRRNAHYGFSDDNDSDVRNEHEVPDLASALAGFEISSSQPIFNFAFSRAEVVRGAPSDNDQQVPDKGESVPSPNSRGSSATSSSPDPFSITP